MEIAYCGLACRTSHPNQPRSIIPWRNGRPSPRHLLLAALIVLSLSGITLKGPYAKELKAPEGTVILTIRGAIGLTNSDGAARFDRAMLEALPKHSVQTETPWIEDEVRFEGPLLRDVLSAVEAAGSNLRCTALNDYTITIPREDADAIDSILAMTMNGQTLTTRTKGPLWVIYPWDKKPALRNETYYSRSVWQLKEIVVE